MTRIKRAGTTLLHPAALALLLPTCFMGRAGASEAVLQYDDGSGDHSTVIGTYRQDGQSYHQVADFSLHRIDHLEATIVQLHAHVGPKIKPMEGESQLRIGVRINAGPWQWQSLDAVRDGKDHWLNIAVPVDQWRVGLNRVETASTVISDGNRTESSLDLLGSAHCIVSAEVRHSADRI